VEGPIPFTDTGIVEATGRWVVDETPDAIWRRVLSGTSYIGDADRETALTATQFIRPPGANRTGFHIANGHRVVAIQGGWWYRGVTSVEPHGGGTLVTHTVINVAPGLGKWAAHFVQARPYRRAKGPAPFPWPKP
jgi:hypothetical protein